MEHVELHGVAGATTRLSSGSFVPGPYLAQYEGAVGASAQSWLAVGGVSRALPEPVALVGAGDWAERPRGKAAMRRHAKVRPAGTTQSYDRWVVFWQEFCREGV